MDHHRFDRLTIMFARGANRRTFLRRLGGGSLTALLGVIVLGHDPHAVDAKPKGEACGKKGNPCCAPPAAQCAGNLNCVDDFCARPIQGSGTCLSGQAKCGGRCIDLGTNANCSGCDDACTAPESCLNGTCGLAASCSDGIMNGDETDVDCGGSCGATCATDQTCIGNNDCASGLCQNGACGPASPCSDGIQNDNETDIDCGGGSCPRCADGKMCKVPGDCAGRRCLGGICQSWPVCLAGQEYCPSSRELVQCGPGCACATSLDTGVTVCAGHSVRLCSACTTDSQCTTELLLVGFPDTPGVCALDTGGCACPNSNVCVPASCGCGSDGSLCD